jgi:hypothetical protein
MKPTSLFLLLMTILTVTATARADGPTTKPHALPPDAQTPVITLDRNGGMILRRNQEPVFQILSDGTAIVGNPFGMGRTVKGKLTPDQLQDLLHSILDDEKFDDITPADLQMNGHMRVTDATTTTISVEADGVSHSIGGAAVEMVAQQAGKDSAASRFVEIAERIEAIRRVVALGGDDAVKKLLDAANAKLKTDLPDEPPVQPGDLANARAAADGSEVATFSRKTILPEGKWHLTQAVVTDDGKGNVDVKVAKGADQ